MRSPILCICSILIALHFTSGNLYAEDPPAAWRQGSPCMDQASQDWANATITAGEYILTFSPAVGQVASALISIFADGFRTNTTNWFCYCETKVISVARYSLENEYVGNDLYDVTFCNHNPMRLFKPSDMQRCTSPIYNVHDLTKKQTLPNYQGWKQCN